MAWLARSLANSLRLDELNSESDDGGDSEEEGEEERVDNDSSPSSSTDSHGSLDRARSCNEMVEEPAEELQARGVKEDLNELKQTLTRQLWGVANFLAPPPSQPPASSQSDSAADERDRLGTPSHRSASTSEERELADEVAIKERFREMKSRLEPIESDGECGDEEEFEEVELIGVTDEVLAFARNIGMHPETWLDFPLDADEDLNDFKISDAQQEHALAIENLAPRFRALRIELCPFHMSESYFWKVYFVLLHSRLEKHDADILSTPQVMEARSMWMQELKRQAKPEFDWHRRTTYHLNVDENDDILHHEDFPGSPSFYNARRVPVRPSLSEHERSSIPTVSDEPPTVDKSVIGENHLTKRNKKDSYKMCVEEFDDDDDYDWPEEEGSDLVGCSGAVVSMGIEEDISFSDLEDDIDVSFPFRAESVSDGQERTGS